MRRCTFHHQYSKRPKSSLKLIAQSRLKSSICPIIYVGLNSRCFQRMHRPGKKANPNVLVRTLTTQLECVSVGALTLLVAEKSCFYNGLSFVFGFIFAIFQKNIARLKARSMAAALEKSKIYSCPSFSIKTSPHVERMRS